nr:hypothetical protein [Tanacetum cinerariifolium]
MSSASSAVTYNSIYTDSEPGRVFWGADEELSDGDYIRGPEEPQTPPVSQDEDERKPMFIQPHDPDYPLPLVVAPIAESPEYVVELDPEEDPEEYEDDESGNHPVDYPMDGGDDRDDDDGDSSRDNADDEEEDEEDDNEEEEEEEEHLALADSAIVVHTIEPASISLPPEVEVERLLAMPTPPPSQITRYHHPLQRSAWLASTQALIDAVTAALPSPPLPLLPLSLYIPPPVNHLEDAIPEIAPITLGEVNTRVTELAELHKHDTQDLYALLEDAQDSRTRIS